MAKCHRNVVGSLVLDSPTAAAGSHSSIWTSFSGSAFRRKLFNAMSCGGGGSRHRPKSDFVAETRSVSKPSKPPEKQKKAKSEKLSDLLKIAEYSSSETDTDVETKKKVEALEELKFVAKELQGEDSAKRKAAASNVRLRAKEDSEARATLAMLGAIPPLVGMLDHHENDAESQIASLYALLNLGIGNDANKAAIVKAGAVHNMLKLIESPNAPNPLVSEAIVANFLGLSALDLNKSVIGSSGAIPFLVKTLKDLDHQSSPQSKQDALRALYNLSIFSCNVPFILDADLIPLLLKTLGDMELSERCLAILSNLVSTPEGRKAISVAPDSFPVLIDALNWNDSPGCQEKASYILMVMAHKAYGDRQAMIEAGIASSLLELTLLGSTLAQKRASRILDCLRVDKGKQVSENYGGNLGAAVSAPIYGSSSSSTNPNGGPIECLEEAEDMMSEEKKAVKQLVQLSVWRRQKI